MRYSIIMNGHRTASSGEKTKANSSPYFINKISSRLLTSETASFAHFRAVASIHVNCCRLEFDDFDGASTNLPFYSIKAPFLKFDISLLIDVFFGHSRACF